MKPGWLVVALTAVSLVVPSSARPAAADPLDPPVDTVAFDYLQQGNRFYHLHDLAHAIDAYRSGSLRDDAPVFLFNLAQCHRQLGNYADSIWHYERFLARARPTGELATTIADFIASMRRQLPSVSDPDDREAWYLDTAGWTLLGAGLATAATGAWLAVDANHLLRAADSESQQSTRLDLRATAANHRDLALTAGLAATGLAIAGVIKLALRDESVPPRARARSSRSAWSLAITGHSVAVEVPL